MKIFSYWSGPVSWMERLSAASAKATGHDLTIYSYEPETLRREGLDATIADAREVFVDPGLDGLNGRLPDHFSDHFRVEGLAQGLGAWVDLDFVFLKPLPSLPYLFGWERQGFVCNALLGLPSDSAILSDYLAFCRRRPLRYMPPWWSWQDHTRFRLKQARRVLTGRKVPKPHEMAFPYGPPMLSHLIVKHGLQNQAQEQAVFYPAVYKVARIGSARSLDEFATDDTIAVHLWRTDYRKWSNGRFPDPDTWLAHKCQELLGTRRNADLHA